MDDDSLRAYERAIEQYQIKSAPRRAGKNSRLTNQSFGFLPRGKYLPDGRVIADFKAAQQLVLLSDETVITYEQLKCLLESTGNYPLGRQLKEPNDQAAIQVLVRYAREVIA